MRCGGKKHLPGGKAATTMEVCTRERNRQLFECGLTNETILACLSTVESVGVPTADFRIQLPVLLVRRLRYKGHIALSVLPFDNFFAQYYSLVVKYLYVCFSGCFMFVYLSIYLVVCISYLSIYYIYLY